jgi:hypothetical protein
MKRSTMLILAAIVIVGGVLRFYHIGQASFWYDEFCSLEDSSGHGLAHFHLPTQRILAEPPDLISLSSAAPMWRIWTSLKRDNHPPLFFILLRIWREVFGDSEAAARSLPALAGIAAIFCIYDVARIAHGRATGLWAAAIFAVAGPQVLYAQETRGYTLAVLWGLCMLDALVRIQKIGLTRRRLIVLAVAELLLMLTHYQGIPLAVALGFYVLLVLRGANRWKTAATMVAAALIYIAIWGPFLIAQRNNIGPLEQGFLFVGDWSKSYSLQQLAALPIMVLGPPVAKNIWSVWPSAIIYLLPLLLVRKNPFLLLWFFWLLGTAGFLGVRDRLVPSHELSLTRYILICGPGFYLFYAGMLANMDGKWWMQYILPALAVLFCVVSLPTSFAERRWPDWRAITAAIDRMKKPGDLMVFASDGKDDWFSGEYMSYAFYAQHAPKNVVVLTGPAEATLLEQMRNFSGAVIVNGTDRKSEDSLPGYHVVDSVAFQQFVNAERMERNTER